MKPPPRQARGWAVCNPQGVPWLYAVTFLRKSAINLAEHYSGMGWDTLRAHGYTVRRVVVQEDAK